MITTFFGETERKITVNKKLGFGFLHATIEKGRRIPLARYSVRGSSKELQDRLSRMLFSDQGGQTEIGGLLNVGLCSTFHTVNILLIPLRWSWQTAWFFREHQLIDGE